MEQTWPTGFGCSECRGFQNISQTKEIEACTCANCGLRYNRYPKDGLTITKRSPTPDAQAREALAVAQELRLLRECEAGEVPCPFCHWEHKEGEDNSESGCLHWAERILAAIRSLPRQATPDGGPDGQ